MNNKDSSSNSLQLFKIGPYILIMLQKGLQWKKQ